MKRYIGGRTQRGTPYVHIVDNEAAPFGRALDPKSEVHNHTPHGFDWGQPGLGASQLALALLCEHFRDDDWRRTAIGYAVTGEVTVSGSRRTFDLSLMAPSDEAALTLYPLFHGFVDALPHGNWEFGDHEINQALERIYVAGQLR